MFSEVSLNDVVDGIGMIGFALAGLLATEKYRVDPVGVFVAIFSTAFGGGIVRDIMLDLRPFYWMSHPQWIWLAFVMTIFAPPLIRKTREGWRNIVYIWADAIGLAFFAVGSTATAWSHNQGAFVSVLIGVATGVFGGMLRDVFCNRLPAVLSDKKPYAAAAFLGGWLYLGLIEWSHVDKALALWFSCFVVVAVRMISFKIPILEITYDDDDLREQVREQRHGKTDAEVKALPAPKPAEQVTLTKAEDVVTVLPSERK